MTKEELKSYLIEICEYDEDYVNSLDDRDLFDKYLCYEGIIGFTDEIIDTCNHLNFDDADTNEIPNFSDLEAYETLTGLC